MENMIGVRIKNRRKELKITGKQVKEKTGISTGNLSDIENGKVLPSAIALMQLSKILNCSTDYILFGETLNFENSDIRISEFLKKFQELSQSDQNDVLEMIDYKIFKAKRKNDIPETKSSPSTSIEDNNNMVV